MQSHFLSENNDSGCCPSIYWINNPMENHLLLSVQQENQPLIHRDEFIPHHSPPPPPPPPSTDWLFFSSSPPSSSSWCHPSCSSSPLAELKGIEAGCRLKKDGALPHLRPRSSPLLPIALPHDRANSTTQRRRLSASSVKISLHKSSLCKKSKLNKAKNYQKKI